MKKTLSLIALLICMVAGAAPARTAASILEAVSARMRAAGTVETTFVLTGSGQRVDGTMITSGAKIMLKTPGFSMWYDGRTQWTLVEATGEVNISEPTLEELMESNPFAILSDWSSHYSARRLPDEGSLKVVELTPKASMNSRITRAVISVGADNSPAGISVTFADGSDIAVAVTKMKNIANKPAAFFRFDPSAYPTYEIVDLR